VKFDLSIDEGQRVWESCLLQTPSFQTSTQNTVASVAKTDGPRYGAVRLIQPRLGQATFRITVLDAYGRACAVTKEHSLPALEAAHTRSFAREGPHEVRNGLLLRADLHRLFDTGYVTVTPDLRLEVGARLRVDYDNGRSYYPLHGVQVDVPTIDTYRPDPHFLRWHNDQIFRG